MLSKAKIKLFNSLSHKKFRDTLNLYTAEGDKLVTDLLSHFECKYLVAEQKWIDNLTTEKHSFIKKTETIIVDSADEIKKISTLNTPSPVFAVFAKPEAKSINELSSSSEMILALDTIQDPGNMGTIIRTADWFGIKEIICSFTTADIFNPKAVQATMGAIANVNISYCNLEQTISQLKRNDWHVYGTLLNGQNIYSSKLNKNKTILVMGNEGKGISQEIIPLIDTPLLIPPFGKPISDSMNVAIATAITLSEFFRT